MKDESRLLKPGMFGRVQIVYDTRQGTLLIPKEAVIEEDEEVSLYVVQDSQAFRKPIERGYADEKYVEVVSGLDEGAQVITAGQGSLRDSSKVEVID